MASPVMFWSLSVCLPHHRKPVIAISCVSMATEVEAFMLTSSSASAGLRGGDTGPKYAHCLVWSALCAELFPAHFPGGFSTRQRRPATPRVEPGGVLIGS